MLTIAWTTFEAIDHSQIMQQTATVTVVDGNLHVQLVPTTTATPAAMYTVTYNSDGRIQFQETWAVPSSVQALHVRDVRVVTAGIGRRRHVGDNADAGDGRRGVDQRPGRASAEGAGVCGGTGGMGEPDGRAGDRDGESAGLRAGGRHVGPVRGRVAGIHGQRGAGRADGWREHNVRAGGAPNPAASVGLYRNGMLQKAGPDYSLSGNTITFVPAAVPQAGDTLLASYRTAGGSSSSGQLYPNPQVLCSGLGASTTSATMGSVGTCTIPSGFLGAGDRIEIRFDVEHQGSAGGYSFEARWGATTLVHRDAAAGDTLATGRADLALKATGAQVSHLTWGTSLAFTAGVGTAGDDYFGSPITIDLRALAAPGDTVTLRSYTVTRFP